MLDGVICDRLFLVCRDNMTARLSTDPRHNGLSGVLIKDDPKPGTACAYARADSGVPP